MGDSYTKWMMDETSSPTTNIDQKNDPIGPWLGWVLVGILGTISCIQTVYRSTPDQIVRDYLEYAGSIRGKC